MLELVVFCVILLAAGYWATMFVMGRRDDVIHGKFVHTEDVFAQSAMPTPRRHSPSARSMPRGLPMFCPPIPGPNR